MTCDTDPPRLLTSSDELGSLVRSANRDYDVPTDEPAAWQRLVTRHQSRADRVWRNVSYAVIPLAAAAAYLLYVRAWRTDDHPLAAADPATVAVTSGTIAYLERLQPIAKQPAISDVIEPPRASSEPQLHNVDCEQAMKSGPPRVAATCLEQRINGSTLDAERAVFALAKLKSEKLRDPHGAIGLLKGYRQRFPDGALKGEVDFALVALLPKVGQSQEAMSESETLLNTAWGRTRSSELRLLRGRLAQDQLGNCTLALKEFSYIRSEFGPTGDEATLRSAECLERDGRSEDAKSTYREYLARPGASKSEFARARLGRLEGEP